jgi:16S rRNA (guanine966-N2)-methyltransferase
MTDRPATAPGRIRIIGGSLRNSRLNVPDLPGLRPTAERVRETLFNWLAPYIAGMRCLDLCAGTGALGIEALSRGAASVQFVERDPRAVLALLSNLQRLKTTGANVVAAEARLFLQGAPQAQDLVFLDPPFALELWAALAQQLEQGGWLAAKGWVYVESPRARLPVLPLNWRLHREGHAGEVRFALYQR